MINPYSRVVPRFASKIVAIAVGPGCGGRKQCVTDKAATIGTPTYSKGSPDEATIVKTSGNSSTNPTSKNIARPTISPVITSAHCTRFLPNVLMSVVAMRCAAPVSEINLPSIAPKPRIMASPPRVPPIPFCMECRTSCAPIPSANPTTAATRTRAIKPLTLKPIIKTNSSATPAAIIINGIFVSLISAKIAALTRCVVFPWSDGNQHTAIDKQQMSVNKVGGF